MIENLVHLFQQHATAGYIVLFFSMIIEATLTLLTVGALLAQQLINPYVAVIIMLVGALTEQTIFYFIGHALKKSKFIIHWTAKIAHRFDGRLLTHPGKVLFISKFIYGLHRTTLMRAGMLSMGFRKFIRACLPATCVWVLVVGFIGYSVGASYEALKEYAKYAELIPLAIVVLFFGLEYMASKEYQDKI